MYSISNACESLVYIRSKETNAGGTGFVIFKDQTSAWILTCAHVVRDAARRDQAVYVRTDAENNGDLIPAIVVDSIETFGVDLAVLRCDSAPLSSQQVLPLKKLFTRDVFQIASFQLLLSDSGPKRDQPTLTFHTLLGDPSGRSQNLQLRNSAETPITPGHSGSPVIESATGRAVAVVTDVAAFAGGRDEGNGVILALPVDCLEDWKGKPAGLTIEDLPLQAGVQPVPSNLIAVNPVQILIAASNGFDNEIAIIQETANRTQNASASRGYPVELYRWAQPAILPLGHSSKPPALDEFHGLIFVLGANPGVPEEAFEALVTRLPVGSPKQRRRIVIYRIGEDTAAADDFSERLPPGERIECSPRDFPGRFWNDYQRLFPELLNLSTFPLRDRSAVALRSPGDIKPPYRGLESYREEDAALFHGRASEVTELRNMLAQRENGLLAVVGPSGSGKSSLVRAGLLYRLRLNGIPGSEGWKIVDVLLSKHPDWAPTLTLADELAKQVLYKTVRRHEYTSVPKIRNDLEQQPDKLVDVTLNGEPSGVRLVVFVDQFEEIFTFFHVQDPNKSAAFLTCLLRLANHKRTNVILTMRDDFYGRLLQTDLSTMVEAQQPFWLRPPDDRSLINAIYLPAALSGFRFEDQNLILQILRDAGSGAGTLPLLSYALERLVERAAPGVDLTWKAYDDIGRVQGVIQNEADLALAAYDETGETIRRIFRRLVSVSETGAATKKPAGIDSTWTDRERELKDALVKKRLLVTRIEGQPSSGAQPPPSVVEIAHEALLNDWPFMKNWIREQRAKLVLMQDVEAAAAKWNEERGKIRIEVASATWEEARIRIDRDHLWSQDRLDEVDKAIKALGLSATALSPVVQTFIRPESARLIEELNLPVNHARRAEIGERLAELRDPRRGVRLRNGLPDVVWCPVPGAFEVKPFYIARYPITMAQFDVFANNNGNYQNEKWWAGLAVEPKSHPVYAQNPKTINHPAQFVSWYQAVAFCRWLSEQVGYNVRLPMEYEWQQAATGGNEDILYPWGAWDSEKANHRLGAYRLMAVGMYPMGRWPGGPYDMSGNMFEWCMNEFDNPAACEPTGTAPRTTRGGAWFSTKEEITVRYRLNDNPDGFNDKGRRLGVCIRLASDAPPRDLVLDDRDQTISMQSP